MNKQVNLSNEIVAATGATKGIVYNSHRSDLIPSYLERARLIAEIWRKSGIIE